MAVKGDGQVGEVGMGHGTASRVLKRCTVFCQGQSAGSV